MTAGRVAQSVCPGSNSVDFAKKAVELQSDQRRLSLG